MIVFIKYINYFYRGIHMDLRSLNTFIQVAELASFTKAAERLGYSQPTISFQIRQLEEELGVRLFDRIGHTVSLTAEGREALSYAQRICRMASDMSADALRDRLKQSVIRIAMADSLCNPLVVEKFASLRLDHRNISLKVMTGGTDTLFHMIDHNDADIVCTLDSHIYNISYVIAHEKQIGAHFVCSSASPLAQIESLQIGELLGSPFILTEKGMSYRRLLDEKLASISVEIEPVLELGSTDLICRLVERNAGFSFLPDYVTEQSVNEGKIVRLNVRDFDIELWVQILYHKDKWITPQIQTVIDHLKK